MNSLSTFILFNKNKIASAILNLNNTAQTGNRTFPTVLSV